MRILQVVSGNNVNGAVKHCLDLTLALQARGHEVHVACRPTSWIAKQLIKNDVPIIQSDLRRLPQDELKRVAQYISDNKIDVVHTHMSRAHFFGVLLRWFANVPCVASAHCRQFQLHWTFNDFVIAVSDATRAFHRKINLVRKSKIETIHNFVHLPTAETNEAKAERVKARFLKSLNISPGSKLITFVGGLEKRKGLRTLFESLPTVFADQPNAQLLVVGEVVKKKRERKYMKQAIERAEELGVSDRIHFLGFRSDVTEILSHSDVFVLPSIEESFPLTILEAMSVGIPVVATDVGGVAECVTDGVNGFVVPSGSAEALGARLANVLNDEALAAKMGTRGRQDVEANYGIDQQLAKIEAVFERVTGGKSSAGKSPSNGRIRKAA